MTKPATSTSTAAELTAELEKCRHAMHERLEESAATAAEIQTIGRRISEILDAAARKSPRRKKAKAGRNRLVLLSDSAKAQLQKGGASVRSAADAFLRAERKRYAKALRALADLTRANNERFKAMIRGTIPRIRAVLLLSAPARDSIQAEASATCAKTER